MFLISNKRKLCLYSTLFATFVGASLNVQVAQAGSMYVYKDNNGQILLTNVTPEGNFNKFTQQVRVSHYPDPVDAYDNNALVAPSTAGRHYPTRYQGFSTPSRSHNRNAYDGYIRASALRHGVDPALMKAMMHTESAFNPNARSPVGAQGLMQLMPATARRFSVANPWNPAENIEGAAKYIAWLTKRFNGNMEHVVAGYNAGEGNVDKYNGIPPFRETQNYVKRVLGRYNTLYRHDRGLISASTNQSIRSSASINGGNDSVRRVNYTPTTTYGTSRNYSQSAFDALR